MGSVKTELIYSQKMPLRGQFPEESVLLFDAVLNKHAFFRRWRAQFKHALPLTAGESLKTLGSYQKVLKKLTEIQVPQTTQLTFVAVGGGSVGDLAGFVASTFLRGRNFVQIPSTWLAAIDSAHGGKNGLNFAGSKNQIGTIFPASRVFLVKSLLKSQPAIRQTDAFGEALKMALINSPKTITKLEKKNINLFSLLPELIGAKMKIVNSDPFERLGNRRLLNLGHTIGHVLESYFKLSHGESVRLGLLFSVRWSFQRKYLKQKDFVRLWNLLHQFGNTELQTLLKKLPEKAFIKGLVKDKKRLTNYTIDFIFLKQIGRVFRVPVTTEDIVTEFRRQKQEF